MLFRVCFRWLVFSPLRRRSAGRWLSLDASKRFECKIDLAGRCSLILSRDSEASFYDGCAIATVGGASVMATVVGHPVTESTSCPSLPLAVGYRHAYDRIPINQKSLSVAEYETITAGVIERSLRPLFTRPYHFDTQIMCTPLFVDGINYMDVLSINAASAALALSDIPWNGPVGAVRIGQCGGNLVVNPSHNELFNSELNLVIVSAAQNLVVLLEGTLNNITKETVLKAVELGIEECQHIVSGIGSLQKQFGSPKRELEMKNPKDANGNLETVISGLCENKLQKIFANTHADNDKIAKNIKGVKTEVIECLKSKFNNLNLELCSVIFDKICKQVFRNYIYNNDTRYNVRKFNELRNPSCIVYFHKPQHEEREEQTNFSCNVALDSEDHVPKFDLNTLLKGFRGIYENRFFINYELSSYEINDVGQMISSNRCEIKRKALGEQDLKSVFYINLPVTKLQTPEVLKSNDNSKVMDDELVTDKSEPEFELGAIYKAKVVKIQSNGVLIKLYSTMKPVLIHNYQLDPRKINHPSALDIEKGHDIQVKYLGRDPVTGIMSFSRGELQKSTLSLVQNIGGKNAS